GPAARVGPARQRGAGQRRRHAGLGLPGLGTAAARQSDRANHVIPRLARALRGTDRSAARDRRLTRRAEPKHAAGAPARPCRAHGRAVAHGPRAAQVCGGSVEGPRMRPTGDLPDGPPLPGLTAIRERGVARAAAARVLGIGWLEALTAHDLVKQGQGRHAGELAAQWVRRTASVPVKLGLPCGTAGMMHETRAWIGTLGTADLSVGAAARALAEALAR